MNRHIALDRNMPMIWAPSRKGLWVNGIIVVIWNADVYIKLPMNPRQTKVQKRSNKNKKKKHPQCFANMTIWTELLED